MENNQQPSPPIDQTPDNRQKLIIGTILSIAIIIVLGIIYSLLAKTSLPLPHPGILSTASPTPTISVPLQIVSVDPPNDKTNVSAGEITVTVTFNRAVTKADNVSLSISPALPNYWKQTSTIPSNKITMQIYGSLKTNTKYTVVVLQKSMQIYTWSFTTTNQQAVDSSQALHDIADQVHKKYYPLLPYTPYQNDDYYVEYSDKLTLEVDIRNPDIEKVKQEVNDWIKSKGVDPSTHKINYVNDF